MVMVRVRRMILPMRLGWQVGGGSGSAFFYKNSTQFTWFTSASR